MTIEPYCAVREGESVKFYIQCKSCMENITIRDGYSNEDEIEIKIIGESVVEIKCNSCGNTISTVDGDYI